MAVQVPRVVLELAEAGGGPRDPVLPFWALISAGAWPPVVLEYAPPVQPLGQSAIANESEKLDGPGAGAGTTTGLVSSDAGGRGAPGWSLPASETVGFGLGSSAATSAPPLATERVLPWQAPPFTVQPAIPLEPFLVMLSEPEAADVTLPVQPCGHSIDAFASDTLDGRATMDFGATCGLPSIMFTALPVVEPVERASPVHVPPATVQETLLIEPRTGPAG